MFEKKMHLYSSNMIYLLESVKLWTVEFLQLFRKKELSQKYILRERDCLKKKLEKSEMHNVNLMY